MKYSWNQHNSVSSKSNYNILDIVTVTMGHLIGINCLSSPRPKKFHFNFFYKIYLVVNPKVLYRHNKCPPLTPSWSQMISHIFNRNNSGQMHLGDEVIFQTCGLHCFTMQCRYSQTSNLGFISPIVSLGLFWSVFRLFNPNWLGKYNFWAHFLPYYSNYR